MIKQFFLGFIKIHILHHADKEPVYGVWIMEELAHHGYKLSPGTLYPILHSLESEGWLSCKRVKTPDGKIRKYYTTTPSGRAALADAKEKISELVDEVVLGKKEHHRGRKSEKT